MLKIMQRLCKMEQNWSKDAKGPRTTHPGQNPCHPSSHGDHATTMHALAAPVASSSTLPAINKQQTMHKTPAEVRQHAQMKKAHQPKDFGRRVPADAKTEKTGAVLRTSEVLAITFNPDRISQNVQHKNCIGETDLKLCRRKHRDRTSRFWDIAGCATCNSRRWNPNSAENKVWVWLGF